jgi:hypothetical protein
VNVGYDCVRYFEPKTARPMKDVLGVPESFFMLYDTIVARVEGLIQVLSRRETERAHPQGMGGDRLLGHGLRLLDILSPRRRGR